MRVSIAESRKLCISSGQRFSKRKILNVIAWLVLLCSIFIEIVIGFRGSGISVEQNVKYNIAANKYQLQTET